MFLANSNKLNQDKNPLDVCRFLLKAFKIKHTTNNLEKIHTGHLEHPSILSIADSLQVYGIQCAVIRKGNFSYIDFETPFICAIQQAEWSKPAFTVVHECDSNNITYLDPLSSRLKVCSLDVFETMDKEIIMLVDNTGKKDEVNYEANKKKQFSERLFFNIPVCFLSFVVLITLTQLLASISAVAWISSLLLVTSTVGLLMSALLVWHDVDAHNPFIKEVCGGGKRNKLNCNAVLSSSGARFFGISWSIWGFAYFATFFVSQIIFTNQLVYIGLWSKISLISLLYVPYSLYYQSRVIKQWCPLCLVIQALITCNAILSLIFLNVLGALPITFQAVFNIFFLGLTILLQTYFAVPLFKRVMDGRNYEKRWRKLRFDPDIFQALLSKSDTIKSPVDDLGILIGSPEAKNEIIKVCNPFCDPCSKAHPELENIIKNNSDVRLRIIFTASGDESDMRTHPVAHFLALQEKYGREHVKIALDEWYHAERKDYKAFAEKYPLNGELLQQQGKIIAMRDWCNMMKVRATPTIFINGNELPDSYLITELKNFL